jgi:hypothetical protein
LNIFLENGFDTSSEAKNSKKAEPFLFTVQFNPHAKTLLICGVFFYGLLLLLFTFPSSVT